MPYCTKCGVEVEEKMVFCPKCGAPLKVEKPAAGVAPASTYRVEKAEKSEKSEKQEKAEKTEKTEKYEKREVGVVGPLIGGLVLIFLGCLFLLGVTGYLIWENVLPFLLVIVGALIIIGVLYGAKTASKRHPRT